MKYLFYIVMILMIAGTGQLNAQAQGDPAPDFEVDLLEPDSATFKLSDQEGKVVLVFLFGNTCPSCLSAGSDVETSIYQVFKDNTNFTAIGIDTWDTSSNKSSVTEFKNTTGISFPLALKGGSVAATYQTTYDRLMVIDGEGKLVHKGILVARNDLDNTVEAINQSLAVTGLDLDSDIPQLNVFPNPVSDVLHIATGGASISGISLYDITGKRVHDAAFSGLTESSSVEIPLQHLEQGIYFYSIKAEDQLYTGKLLIQR